MFSFIRLGATVTATLAGIFAAPFVVGTTISFVVGTTILPVIHAYQWNQCHLTGGTPTKEKELFLTSATDLGEIDVVVCNK